MPITSAWSSCPQCGKALFKEDDACQSCGYQLSEEEKRQIVFDIDHKNKIGISAGVFVFGLVAFMFILLLLW